jgi:ERF superfamily
VQRSSETIGTIAAALAKAQIEITNPEKSLIGTIGSRLWEKQRTFRYAPLSSGLDIVRKSLGRHEIATVQTTALNPDTGLIHLTTMLAHSSGEWLASDWPVCPISETAAPQRMGAALTYARRYALFALVGIAGEDDLDAPDLPSRSEPVPKPASAAVPKRNGGSAKEQTPRQEPTNAESRTKPGATVAPALSGSLRELLLAQVQALDSPDAAVVWARKSLSVKNSLNTADARAVEDAFRAKIASLEKDDGAAVTPPALTPGPEEPAAANAGSPAANQVDKSVLGFPETRRLRDKGHIKWVSNHPCLICGRQPCEAHHLRFAQPRALGRRVSDEFTVPLCRVHHRELHRVGNERSWWDQFNIEPMPIALRLWQETRGVIATETSAFAVRKDAGTSASSKTEPAPPTAGAAQSNTTSP